MIDAKEKAKELVYKKFGCKKHYAKLAVDLHLEELSKMKLIFSDRELNYKYWEEVKSEIEKL